MKIYVVTQSYAHGETWVDSVWSTPEKAEERCVALEAKGNADYQEIDEYELDKVGTAE